MEGIAYYIIDAAAIAAARISWVIGRTIVERSAVREGLKDTPPEQRAEIIHELSRFRASGQRDFIWGGRAILNGKNGRSSTDGDWKADDNTSNSHWMQ
jgi:hypothetical protein